MATIIRNPLVKIKKRGSKIFDTYQPREYAGRNMIKNFMELSVNKNAKGFLLDENEDTATIVSQCYGILTLAEYAKFGVDFSESENSEAVQKINSAFNDVLERLKIENGLPQNDEMIRLGEKTPTETLSLFLRTLIEVRNLLCKDLENQTNVIKIEDKFLSIPDNWDENNETRTEYEIKFTEKLIADCFEDICNYALSIEGADGEGEDYYLNNSDIALLDSNGQKMRYKGWTFRRMPKEQHAKTEMSLYFTYLINEAYLAFYESFEEAIQKIRILVEQIKIKNGWAKKSDKAIDYEYSSDEEVSADAESTDEDFGDESDKDKSLFTMSEEMLQQLDDEVGSISEEDMEIQIKSNKLFHKNFEFIKEHYSAFRKFNKVIVDAGRYVDSKFSSIDTSKNFFSYNFKVVTEQSVLESSASDAFFNVLFAINIMITAGIDMDYKEAGKDFEFYENLQSTIPNMQRLYRRLEREGRENICDRYMLKFNEFIPRIDEENPDSPFNQVKVLKKKTIYALNLMPLLIKTYTNIARYMIPYPQYDMQSYAQQIGQNMLKETIKRKDKISYVYKWCWDKDGYHLVTNYNYVYALRLFYAYKEKYEDPLSGNQEVYNKQSNILLKAQKEFESSSLKRESEYKAEIKAAEEKHKAISARYEKEIEELKNKKVPIEEEIIKLIKSNMESAFKDILNEIIVKNGFNIFDMELEKTFKKAVLVSCFKDLCDDNASKYTEEAMVESTISDLSQRIIGIK